ncbi:RagB/SusD family nutrient uptake outer membrane protein [Gaopeijia maritima]|uniref:RagB/SusD family nutrient uptake outer membrane protein n=1 Tax=Gaopeijia maritima TaxID=3119007 RepID=A0ABU9E7T9_9BACT
MKIMNRKSVWTVALLLPLAGCSEVLSLDVESPGRIADDDLNNADAVPGLVAGMSYDLTQAYGGVLQELSLASGELWHGGSYDFGTYPRGILLQEPADWDGSYGTMQQARYVAEAGLKRIANVLEPDLYERSPDVARAYLLAGFANRLMGEVQCETTVDFDGEPSGVLPRTEHFSRADSLFSRAIAVGGAAGADAIVTAAYGGRASVRAWLGNWSQAVNDAGQVPDDFQYDAIFSTAVGAVSNDLVFETNSRKEFTVFNTVWADNDPEDPRVPWRIVLDNAGQVEKGQDGETDFYQQLKYLTEDDDQALTKGTEMLVLRAEAALRDGDLQGMTDRLNEARAVYGLDPIDVPGSVAEAWPVLRMERGATVWLEGRTLWDLHRWKAEGGAVADPFAEGRDTCFPISDEEMRVNPNIGG